MLHRSLLVLLASTLTTACHSTAAGDTSAVTSSDEREASGFAARTAAWHAERLERLTAPDGWLTLVALAWLEPGPNRVGNDPAAEVSYAQLPQPHVGTLHVTKDGVRFEPEPGLAFDGLPQDGRLVTDAEGEPTVVELGPIRFLVIERDGRRAVRMKDANAPTRTAFAGIERYPADPAWRIVADFVPAAAGVTASADSVIGAVYTFDVAGRARFVHDGHAVDMILPAASGAGHYVMFGDETNGDGTYAAGRYLLVEPSADGETVVLDFNRAYTPPCGFTPYATCSYPVPANRLPFPVTAGERWQSP